MTPSPPHLIDGIKPGIPVEVVLIFTKSKVEVLPVPELAFKTLEYIFPVEPFKVIVVVGVVF